MAAEQKISSPPPRLTIKTKKRGSLSLFIGPMYSGKTSRMIQEANQSALAGHDCLVIKWAEDLRYGKREELSSREGISLKSAPRTPNIGSISIVATKDLKSVDVPENITYIFIDECQFFAGVAKQADTWASMGFEVWGTALNGTSEREPWPEVSAMIPHIDGKLISLKSICNICKEKASFSGSYHNKRSQIQVGGHETYYAYGRHCSHQK